MKLFTAIIMVFAFSAHAGSEMGNGADNFSADFGSAWFLGEKRTVSYCLDADPAFGRPPQKIRDDIAWAWSKWLSYVDVKGASIPGETEEWRFPRQILEKPCDGREDLRLRLNTEDAEVIRVKDRYQLPSAISHRQSYDAAAKWGKGWIWFSKQGVVDSVFAFPKWSDDIVFRSILLHELGHVFGNIHVSGTIMDYTLSALLKQGRLKDEWVDKIDHTKELLTGGPLANLTGFLGASGYFNPMRVFSWLMGRNPEGPIVAHYRAGSAFNLGELEVKDNKGSQVFSLTWNYGNYNPSYSSDVPVFKRGSFSYLPGGQVVFGTLRHPSFGSVTTVLERNMSSFGSHGPVSMKVIVNDNPQPLFEAFPQH